MTKKNFYFPGILEKAALAGSKIFCWALPLKLVVHISKKRSVIVPEAFLGIRVGQGSRTHSKSGGTSGTSSQAEKDTM